MLPDDAGEVGFKRDYDYASRDLAERDFEQLALVCGVEEERKKTA